MSGTEPGAEGDLTLDEALEIASRAHRAGDLALAQALYARILAVAPEHAGALHFYGILHHQTHRHREAIDLIRRAIALDPEDAGIHSNLGNVLFEVDRPDLAVQAYQTAIDLDPENGEARNNLGVALRALHRLNEAEAVYREAIGIHPGNREAWDNLGRLLAARGRVDEAITCHARALELEPRNAGTRRYLLAAYAATGEKDRALALLRDWLHDEPDSPSARHLRAAISGEDVPDRASDRYVVSLFDAFAASFDEKLARLDYRVPDLMTAAVTVAYPVAGGDLDVLDAGCGTGLCGPGLRSYAQMLEGVDLSAGMLERAASRSTYDRLNQGELTVHLAAHPGAYDLVISADTLCYFGRLDVVFAAAATALRTGGRLIFSIEEAAEGGGFTLYGHGRYGHTRAYVEDCLAAAGLRTEAMRRETLRMERGEPVGGLVITAVRCAGPVARFPRFTAR
jgi:predicted TPR repeat methyltransferase